MLLRPLEQFFLSIGAAIEGVVRGVGRLRASYSRTLKALDTPMARLVVVYVVLFLVIFFV